MQVPLTDQATGIIAQATENDTRLTIASATLLSGDSSIEIVTPTSGTSNANNILSFEADSRVTGANRDYTLNRELGTIELTDTLVAGDNITAGNAFSRATIRTPSAVSSATRVNSGVGFLLTFDNTGTGTSVTRNVVFADDRFSSAYLDDNVNRTNNVEFGFKSKFVSVVLLDTKMSSFISDTAVTKTLVPLSDVLASNIVAWLLITLAISSALTVEGKDKSDTKTFIVSSCPAEPPILTVKVSPSLTGAKDIADKSKGSELADSIWALTKGAKSNCNKLVPFVASETSVSDAWGKKVGSKPVPSSIKL